MTQKPGDCAKKETIKLEVNQDHNQIQKEQ